MHSFIASVAVIAAASLPAAAQSGATSRISVDSSGVQAEHDYSSQPSISSDGRFVSFASRADNLVPGDTNGVQDLFLHDTVTGATMRVSVDPSGAQADLYSGAGVLSADGRYVVFASIATNLVPNDTNAKGDVFVHDMQTGATERVSVSTAGIEANGSSTVFRAAISADGRYVVFSSFASNLVFGDFNARLDVFVRDRASSKTNRVSVDSGGAEGLLDSYYGAISADGRFVVFSSDSSFVPNDLNSAGDVYLFDRQGGLTTLVSLNSSGVQGDSFSGAATISALGRYIVFESVATNLVASDTNGNYDVFVRDVVASTTSRVSVSSQGAQGMGQSRTASISADGRYVGFDSYAANLVPGDTNGVNGVDTFVHDCFTHTTLRTSVDSAGVESNGYSNGNTVSGDGHRIVFQSGATNLVPNDTNALLDVFLREIFCWPASNYCEAGLSTNFCSPTMIASGTASASSSSGFTLTCTGVEGQKTGLILYGVSGRLAQPWGPIGGSVMCVAHPVQRTTSSNSGGTVNNCDGSISIDWLAFVAAHPGALGQPLTPGAIIDAQCWYRDPPAPKGTNLSNGIEFELCP